MSDRNRPGDDDADRTERDTATSRDPDRDETGVTGRDDTTHETDRPADAGPPGDSTAGTGDRRTRSYLAGFVSLLGAWIAVSPFVYGELSQAATWNNVLVGAAIFLAAGYNYYRQSNGIPTNVGVAGLVALLVIWLIVAAVLFEMGTGPFWSTAVTGAIVAILAGANAYAGREARPVGTGTT